MLNDNDCVVDGIITIGCIFPVLTTIIWWLIIFSGVIAVFLIIISGYRYITSGGDPKKVEGARKTMSYTILGILLIFLSFFIVATIGSITGVSCLDPQTVLSFTSCN